MDQEEKEIALGPLPILNSEAGIAALRAKQLLAWPTEGVWGLGCCADSESAVERLLAAKHRSPDKGLILLAASCEDLRVYVDPLDAAQKACLEEPTLQPLTWLVPAATVQKTELSGMHDTQAVRLTRHALSRQLCEAAGALVSSSANVEGEPPARNRHEVEQRFAACIDGIIDGELGGAAGPSEIRHLITGQVVRSA